jgi:hypothetical protein
MTPGGQVVPLSDRPAESAGVPEDVPVLCRVLEDGPRGGPLDKLVGHQFVLAVAIGVGRAQHVQRGAEHLGKRRT